MFTGKLRLGTQFEPAILCSMCHSVHNDISRGNPYGHYSW